MKNIFLPFVLFISSFGLAQNGYWHDVLYKVKSENTEKFTSLVNDYFSSIKIQDDIEAEFSAFIFKSSSEKATHLIGFSCASSKKLAEFKKSLSGPGWELFSRELLKNTESNYTTAGNNTHYSDIKMVCQSTYFCRHGLIRLKM
jgi:hypothetical protein